MIDVSEVSGRSALWSDVEVLCATKLATTRYPDWRRESGVPLRITVGAPKGWKGPKLVDARLLAPYGLLGSDLPIDVRRELYEQRLDRRGVEVVALLARIAREHPGERLCLLCYEDLHAGRECHRRWLAAWIEDRFGVDVPELIVRTSSPQQVSNVNQQPQLPF
jgi:hypothetical protein